VELAARERGEIEYTRSPTFDALSTAIGQGKTLVQRHALTLEHLDQEVRATGRPRNAGR
jgi:hypothetical protein